MGQESYMEEISFEEFISHLDESYRTVFELMEDKTLIRFAKSIAPIMKEKGLTAETILFDKEIKAQADTLISGNADKLLAIETLLKGFEYLDMFLESSNNVAFEDTASKMVTYYMIQYILKNKSKKDIQ
jgi:hypothetical protein